MTDLHQTASVKTIYFQHTQRNQSPCRNQTYSAHQNARIYVEVLYKCNTNRLTLRFLMRLGCLNK